MANTYRSASHKTLVVSAASVATTAMTGVVCGVPLAAILLGIGGLGWLTQYAYLSGPASVATFALLAYGFWHAYSRRRECARPNVASRRARRILWLALMLAVTVNLFEYVVLPRLA